MSPSPRRIIETRKKSLLEINNCISKSATHTEEEYDANDTNDANDHQLEPNSNSNLQIVSTNLDGQLTNHNNNNKFENISDNGSEISDEGYRSLGVIQMNVQKRESLQSQNSMEDADTNGK